MINYKGYFIWGNALKMDPVLADWRALGVVYSKTPEGFLLEAELVGADVFTTKGAAERHGLELCREWVEETLSARSSAFPSAIERNPAEQG